MYSWRLSLKALDDGIYCFSNIASNQYLIVEENGLTLIDTGILGNHRAIFQGIASLGFPKDSLKRILITHADADHYGALPRLQEQTSALTLTSQPEAEAIQAGRASRMLKPQKTLERLIVRTLTPLMRSAPARVDGILAAGDHLPVKGGLIVVNSSGHTPGHLSFYLPDKRILFAGDSIFQRDGRYIPSYGINCWDEQRAIQSLQAQLELEPKIICGGHSVFWAGS